jgi:hypothetical protein
VLRSVSLLFLVSSAMSDFVKGFLYIYSDDWVIFVPDSTYMLYYIY